MLKLKGKSSNPLSKNDPFIEIEPQLSIPAFKRNKTKADGNTVSLFGSEMDNSISLELMINYQQLLKESRPMKTKIILRKYLKKELNPQITDDNPVYCTIPTRGNKINEFEADITSVDKEGFQIFSLHTESEFEIEDDEEMKLAISNFKKFLKIESNEEVLNCCFKFIVVVEREILESSPIPTYIHSAYFSFVFSEDETHVSLKYADPDSYSIFTEHQKYENIPYLWMVGDLENKRFYRKTGGCCLSFF